jgi:hypothetical protein
MPIYRKGESQFGLYQRATEEANQREQHAQEQLDKLSIAGGDLLNNQKSGDALVRGYDAMQELREHTQRNFTLEESYNDDMTLKDRENLIKEKNKSGAAFQVGNIEFDEEFPVSGDDLARGKFIKEPETKGK